MIQGCSYSLDFLLRLSLLALVRIWEKDGVIEDNNFRAKSRGRSSSYMAHGRPWLFNFECSYLETRVYRLSQTNFKGFIVMQPNGNMMQSTGSMMQSPQPQYYQPPPMMPPQQYQQLPPPAAAMWGQQPSQIPHPVPQSPMPTPFQIPSQQYQAAPVTGGAGDEIKTVWIGNLQYWMDENYVATCFAQIGGVVSVKIIRDKQSGQLEGYGFVEFATRAAVEQALQMYNGAIMTNTTQTFRLNWASAGAGERREMRGGDSAEYTIFFGDLAADVTDYILQETFKSHYPSVKSAKVVIDKLIGRPKGYGFVKFGDANEQTRALNEMHGMYCSSRPMHVGPASSKNKVDAGGQYSTDICWWLGRECS